MKFDKMKILYLLLAFLILCAGLKDLCLTFFPKLGRHPLHFPSRTRWRIYSYFCPHLWAVWCAQAWPELAVSYPWPKRKERNCPRLKNHFSLLPRAYTSGIIKMCVKKAVQKLRRCSVYVIILFCSTFLERPQNERHSFDSRSASYPLNLVSPLSGSLGTIIIFLFLNSLALKNVLYSNSNLVYSEIKLMLGCRRLEVDEHKNQETNKNNDLPRLLRPPMIDDVNKCRQQREGERRVKQRRTTKDYYFHN